MDADWNAAGLVLAALRPFPIRSLSDFTVGKLTPAVFRIFWGFRRQPAPVVPAGPRFPGQR